MIRDDEASREREVGRRLRLAVVAPLLVLVAVGIILLNQTIRMSEDARWVEHSDEVIAKAFAAQSAVVDQETSIRGYLLLGEPVQLELYRSTHARARLVELRGLVSDEASQLERAEDAIRSYDAWIAAIERLIDRPVELGAPNAIRLRKVAMDAIRDVLGKLIDYEEQLRRSRVAASSTSSTATRGLTIGLFALAAIVLALLSRRQMVAIATTFRDALDRERTLRTESEREAGIRAGLAALLVGTQGDRTVEDLANATLSSFAKQTGAQAGAFFTPKGNTWQRCGSLALSTDAPASFAGGEGVVGRAAQDDDLLVLHDVTPDHVVRSATGTRQPASVVVGAMRVESNVEAIVELVYVEPPGEQAIELVRRSRDGIAMAVRAARYRSRLGELLEDSQRQGEELQAQQEELRTANEELEHQSLALQERQDELETINARLAERSEQLERADRAMKLKAMELERASQYKSEFLANMSHELRTPLNSSLILAKLLADNKEGNLTEEQLQYARTIHASGNELLALINDVLDLSKVEAGKVETKPIDVSVSRVADGLRGQFEPVAAQRHLDFVIEIVEGTPETIETDVNRLQQILKNLLSNAFKFTKNGSVDLRIARDDRKVRFMVRDTGIGIDPSQHHVIFDAFWQADGTSARKVGGTGLGLSISRDLAKLLGGAITVDSILGEGSTFTLTLPIAWTMLHDEEPKPAPPAASPSVAPPSSSIPPALVADDRDVLDAARRTILIIEDDVHFSHILVDLAHEIGFQCVVAHEANHGFSLARRHPPSAILLDMKLPDRSGLWVLDQLKHTPELRHVPVHVISVADHSKTARSMGAAGYITKPVDRQQLADAFRAIGSRLERTVSKLLVFDGDGPEREAIASLLACDGVEVTAVGSMTDALAALQRSTYDSIVVGTRSGVELLEHVASKNGSHAFPPVIAYDASSSPRAHDEVLRRASRSIVVKGTHSPETLLQEVTLFLHQVEEKLPDDRRQMLARARSRETVFEGRKVLLAEDDVRNIFALSRILEPRGIQLAVARNGREALETLRKTPDIDMVLMDVMMPEMDGLTAIREIRRDAAWKRLPVIVLTAKAMRDDRQRCLDAGANDYIAKPIDPEVLLSLMRIWMAK